MNNITSYINLDKSTIRLNIEQIERANKLRIAFDTLRHFLSTDLQHCAPRSVSINILKIFIGVVIFMMVYSPFANTIVFDLYSIFLKWVGIASVFIILFGNYYLVYFLNHKMLKGYHTILIALATALIAGVFVDLFEALVNTNSVVSFSGSLDNAIKILLLLLLVLAFILARESKKPLNLVDKKRTILFMSKNKREKLNLTVNDIHVIASHENYIKFFYFKNRTLKTSLLRNTMAYANSKVDGNRLVRCHRKYIVNLNKVYSVVDKNQKMYLKVSEINENIVVSKLHMQKVKDYFEGKSHALA